VRILVKMNNDESKELDWSKCPSCGACNILQGGPPANCSTCQDWHMKKFKIRMAEQWNAE